MRRHRWFILVGALLVALSIAATATAKPSSPVPSTGCTWKLNGHIIDGRKCTCERVTHSDGSTSIHCEWEAVAEIRRPVVRVVKKPAKPVATYGISTGAVSHA